MTQLTKLKQDINAKFSARFNRTPEFISAAPGRINIIGEHTDYNFGLSMPAAINRWVIISMAFRDDNTINIASESFGTDMKYVLGQPFTPTESWMKYMQGAIEIFQRADKITKGFDAYIWGNVPLGAGVSSSAAIEVAMMNLLRTAYKSTLDDITLVKNCQKVENEYLLLKSGLLDQYASHFSKEGKLMILDFQSLTHEYADAEMDDWCWVLANSKVKRELAGSKYSERVVETQTALEKMRELNPKIKGFRDITLTDTKLLDEPLIKKRIKHFITENQRVYDVASAFKKKDMTLVGKLMIESHNSLQNDYEVSCPELDFLVETGKKIEGWAGGRMMGGGFGGCTINLIKKNTVETFSAQILREYKAKFNIESEIYAFDAVDGAKCDLIA